MSELTKVTTTELTEVNTDKIQSQSVIVDEQCTNNNDTDTDEEMYVKHNDIETPMNANESNNHGNHGMHIIKEGFYTIAIMDYMAADEDQLNMKQNEIFFIMKILERGWCYAVEENGND
eukprot:47637_1